MHCTDFASWFDPLVARERIDLHKEWARLTNSGALPNDVSFAEYSTAFEAIQREFAEDGSVSLWSDQPGGKSMLREVFSKVSCVALNRTSDAVVEQGILDAIRRGRLVVRVTDRVVARKIAGMRARQAAAASAPAPVSEDLPRVRSQTVTPSQLRNARTGATAQNNGSKAARWKARKSRIAQARKKSQQLHGHERDKLLDAADRFERNNSAVEQAKLAQHVYKPKETPPEGWINISNDQSKLAEYNLDSDHLSIPGTNFRMQVYRPDTDIFGGEMKPQVVFQGTDAGDVTDLYNDAAQSLNKYAPYYDRATLIGEKLKSANVSVEINGHSLGGGLASAASRTSGLPATTFNAAGLSPATVERYSGHPAIPSEIHAYQVEKDALTWVQDASYGLLPAAVGTRHTLPGHGSPWDRHHIESKRVPSTVSTAHR